MNGIIHQNLYIYLTYSCTFFSSWIIQWFYVNVGQIHVYLKSKNNNKRVLFIKSLYHTYRKHIQALKAYAGLLYVSSIWKIARVIWNEKNKEYCYCVARCIGYTLNNLYCHLTLFIVGFLFEQLCVFFLCTCTNVRWEASWMCVHDVNMVFLFSYRRVYMCASQFVNTLCNLLVIFPCANGTNKVA